MRKMLKKKRKKNKKNKIIKQQQLTLKHEMLNHTS